MVDVGTSDESIPSYLPRLRPPTPAFALPASLHLCSPIPTCLHTCICLIIHVSIVFLPFSRLICITHLLEYLYLPLCSPVYLLLQVYRFIPLLLQLPALHTCLINLHLPPCIRVYLTYLLLTSLYCTTQLIVNLFPHDSPFSMSQNESISTCDFS